MPFDFAPKGFVFCEGQTLPINQNAALWTLLGTTYGGNGTTTFALPDLRDRVPIGAGQGAGLPNYVLGQKVGNGNPSLTIANLPGHTHTLPTVGLTQFAGQAAPFDNRQSSLALHFLITANGEIMIVPWTQQPSGWTRCDGRLLSSATCSYLFSYIGTTYGGDSTNFALPDLRGRVIVGDDGSFWTRGLRYGNNDTVLTSANIPAHNHTTTSGNTGSTGGPGNTANNYQPSLALHWLISFVGTYPSPSSGASFPCVGELRLIAGASADGLTAGDWMPLDGRLYSINDNLTLFNLIGTTYGGDGQNTFAVPNLQGRASTTAGNGRTLGEIEGSPSLLISVSQLAAHAHLIDLKVTGLQRMSDGSAQVTLTGTPGTSVALDHSNNLQTWTNVATVQFTTASQTVSIPNFFQNAVMNVIRAHP